MDKYKKLLEELESCLNMAQKSLEEVKEQKAENEYNIKLITKAIKIMEEKLDELGFIKNTLLNYDNTIKNAKLNKSIVFSILGLVEFLLVLLYISSLYDFDMIYILANKEQFITFMSVGALTSLLSSASLGFYKYFKTTSTTRTIKSKYNLEDVNSEIKAHDLALEKLQEALASYEAKKEDLAKSYQETLEVVRNIESQIEFNNTARENAINNPVITEILDKAYSDAPTKLVLTKSN